MSEQMQILYEQTALAGIRLPHSESKAGFGDHPRSVEQFINLAYTLTVDRLIHYSHFAYRDGGSVYLHDFQDGSNPAFQRTITKSFPDNDKQGNAMKPLFTLSFTIFFLCAIFVTGSHAAEHKVLVVMSYEQDNPWCREIKDGIDSVLSGSSQVTYFYMDTKINLKGGEQKAKEAYALYQQLQPDGVITVDDNAQKMFVLSYLKDKTKTPIMFSGVNAEAEKYGFPNSHISGILERGHIRESIAFSMQLAPAIRNVAFFAKDSPSGQALLRQYEKESSSFLSDKTQFWLVRSVADFGAVHEIIRNQYDAIYIDSLEGIEDESGAPMSNRDAIQRLASMFQKPIIGANQYHVTQGALCAVVKTGQEQGETAAQMLLQAMRGTPVSEIPVTRNYKGKRVINVTAMKTLGIEPRPAVLLGATLIKSE